MSNKVKECGELLIHEKTTEKIKDDKEKTKNYSNNDEKDTKEQQKEQEQTTTTVLSSDDESSEEDFDIDSDFGVNQNKSDIKNLIMDDNIFNDNFSDSITSDQESSSNTKRKNGNDSDYTPDQGYSDSNSNSNSNSPKNSRRKPTIKKNVSKNNATNEKKSTKGRLLVNDAIQPLRDSNVTLGKLTKSQLIKLCPNLSVARVKAILNYSTNPNEFYYRFKDLNELQKNGPWTFEEHILFMKRVLSHGVNHQWGIFSKTIPGRVGYQCQQYWKKLIENKSVKDPNYYICGFNKKNNQAIFKFRIKIPKGEMYNNFRYFGFTIIKDKSGVFGKQSQLPKQHPKAPNKQFMQKAIQEMDMLAKKKTGPKKKNINTSHSMKKKTTHSHSHSSINKNNTSKKPSIDKKRKSLSNNDTPKSVASPPPKKRARMSKQGKKRITRGRRRRRRNIRKKTTTRNRILASCTRMSDDSSDSDSDSNSDDYDTGSDTNSDTVSDCHSSNGSD